MSGYLLDTPLVTAYLRGRPGAVALLTPWIAAHQAGTNAIAYGECVEYLRGFNDPQRWQAALRALLRQMRVYAVTYAVMERYADLRRAMRLPHGRGLIGDMDTIIAATALVNDLTLVTLDSDFTRIPGLSLMHLPREAL